MAEGECFDGNQTKQLFAKVFEDVRSLAIFNARFVFLPYKMLNLGILDSDSSRRQIADILIFPRKQLLAFHANCLTICMKCQNLMSGKNKKSISICRLLKILLREDPSLLS